MQPRQIWKIELFLGESSEKDEKQPAAIPEEGDNDDEDDNDSEESPMNDDGNTQETNIIANVWLLNLGEPNCRLKYVNKSVFNKRKYKFSQIYYLVSNIVKILSVKIY